MTDDSFIIDGMRWSFSRLESFYNCPYAWRRTYIDCEPRCNNAFAQYGSLVHGILEEYEKGELDYFDLSSEYEKRFEEQVTEEFPPNKYTNLRNSYHDKGLAYFDNFDLKLDDYEILGVEKEVNFEIYGKPFVGYIDLLLKDKDGKIKVADHKSASISILKNGGIAKGSQEKMEMYKRQLYLYSKALLDAGEKVEFLEWNFFNLQKIYTIPWIKEEYEAAIQWAEDTIKLIEKEEAWLPDNSNSYFCNFICDFRRYCEFKIG